MVLPLAIVGGYAVETMGESRHSLVRRITLLATIAALLLSGYQAVVLSFVRYDDERNPYVYAHTNREILQLVQHVDRVMQRGSAITSPTIAVTSTDYFPLNWYFRRYPAGYYSGSTSVTDPIIIGSVEQDDTLREKFASNFERFGPYALRPGVRLVLYIRRDLALNQ
jgi:hypothetical protein